MKTITTELLKKLIIISFLLFFTMLLTAKSNYNLVHSTIYSLSDTTDKDMDGILDDVDVDDDNDGILDVDEGSYLPVTSYKVVVEIDLDQYEDETSWDLEDSQGNVILNGDNYGDADDIIKDSITIVTEGSYTLKVYDSYGDGMDYSSGSNTNGTSSVSISVNGTLVYDSGNKPDFGYQLDIPFTLGAAITYPISVYSESGVSSDHKITGSPDGQYAKWHSNGDIMIIDFGSTQTAGTEYEIIWKGKKNNKTAIMVLEESTNPVNFTLHSSLPSINTKSQTTINVVSENDFRYLRISQNSQYASEDFEIDAIGLINNASNNATPVFLDSDNDGIVNSYDLDSDNDGIADIIEAGGVDSDNDGLVDGTFLDTDGDGWSDIFDTDDGGTNLIDEDFDNDGLVNRIDIDSDDDGIVDIIESVNSSTSMVLQGINGSPNGIDSKFANGFTSPVNTDGTDNPDYLDLNSDNDVLTDLIEGNDTDNDQIANRNFSGIDSDGDGLDDAFDLVSDITSLTNTTNRQTASSFPNNNNLNNPEYDWRETYDIPNDYDNDGIADNLDSDDDGDGLDDYLECYSESVSVSGTNGGSTNYFSYSDPIMARFDFDYIDNDIEILINGVSLFADFLQFQNDGSYGGDLVVADQSGSLISSPWVTNSNNLPRFRVIIDQSGSAMMFGTTSSSSTELVLLRLTNNSPVGEYTLNNGVNTFAIINSDGPGPDGFSASVYFSTMATCDQDSDLIPNFLDLDSDNDGVTDIVEAGGVDANGDGREDVNSGDGAENSSTITDDDFDGDGIPNRLDIDSDSDGIIDHIEAQTTNDYAARSLQDSDIDGWDNSYDPDNGGTVINLSNNDNIGNHDYLSVDSDGDSSPDWLEAFDDDRSGDALNDLMLRAENFEIAASNPNFYINTDDNDGDQIPDWLEDDDADNTPNFLDPDHVLYQDSDKDGLTDLFDEDTFGQSASLPDSDNAGDKDYRDGSQGVSLPIVLKSFDAKPENGMVRLDWVTSAEINNDYFLIERSINGGDFESIIQIDGAGNSNIELAYVTYDENPAVGDNYYRLRQVDFDGKNTASNIKVVKFSSSEDENKSIEGSIYPNPGNGITLFLELESPKTGIYEVQILNTNGALLNKQQFSIENVNHFKTELLNGKSYRNGTYIVNVIFEDKIKSFKYVVNQL